MRIYIMKKILLALILSVFPLLSSYAQSRNEEATSSLGIFPELPKSSLCTKEKLLGTWKLLIIYEVPHGTELDTYTTLPVQYRVFLSDNRNGEYLGMLRSLTLAQVRNLAIDKQEDLKQYSVNESGRLFFYRNRVAVDSLACFIVEESKAPFMRGQLLLMPPERSSQGKRLLKVYQRVLLEHEVK
jgi:hypothetical protein